MLVHDHEEPTLEPFAVVQVERPTRVSFVIDQSYAYSVRSSRIRSDGFEALTQHDLRKRRHAAIRKRATHLQAQRAVIRLQDLQFLRRAQAE